MDAKFQPMRLLDLRIRDHVTISAGTLGFSTENEPYHANLVKTGKNKKIKKQSDVFIGEDTV